MEPFRPEGVNLPNVMTPGAWALVIGIIAAILSGFGFMFFKYWTKIRVPWNTLGGYYSAKFYIEPGNTTFIAVKLVLALQKAEALLQKHTKWTAVQLKTSFEKICVYVKKDNAWVDYWGRKVAGEDPSGKPVVIGADFAALLHEMAHQAEEKVDKAIDEGHVHWVEKGIRAAEDEYITWLKTVP